MKKRLILVLSLLPFLLSACGSGSVGSSSKGMSESFDGAYINSFDTGGDYSDTYITGDKADYSYTFSAGGNTNKSKYEMLSDYERVQAYVDEKGGYISYVDNSYNFYDLSGESRYNGGRRYKAEGTLRFTVQIDNSLIPDLTNLLETICTENRFIVSDYRQRITNYKAYTVGDETSDPDRVISKDELDRRLQYADMEVTISYCLPRALIIRFFLAVKDIFTGFLDTAGGVIKVFLALTFGFIILFIQIVIFYKLFIKMMYRHREKHPEYYRGMKHVMVHGLKED